MPLNNLLSSGHYDVQQIKLMNEALDEALRLAKIDDRNDARALAIAKQIIGLFEAGEVDPQRIARLAAQI